MKRQMRKWRIDDAYENVYEYDEQTKSYIFFTSFFALGITKKMTEDEQVEIIENSYYQ